ncbi:MAG: hypothetical protein EYC70_10760 [Planctomycetota bacterium]|nr:MAG: hypothetical protein EYC70_10760 [Planctomycetota bacterium]
MLPAVFCFLELSWALRHNPHDTTYSVACAPGGAGAVELLVAGEEPERVLHSTDGGLSWEIVSGAGLERTVAKKVLYDDAGGRRRFLIGTDNGVWALAPGQSAAAALSAGLPLGRGRRVVEMSVPVPGADGPVALLNEDNDVYLWDDAAQSWTRTLNLAGSVSDGLGTLAIAPHFDSAAPPGPARAVVVASNGMLYISADGGRGWLLHPQFAARLPEGWAITAVAPAEDLLASGVVLLARGRRDPANPLRDEGEIWRSTNSGASFSRVAHSDSAILSLAATPAGPSGARWFLAAARQYPNHGYYRGTGILRSSDAGLTWSDAGNDQDFILEPGPGDGTGVRLELRLLQDFAVSPYFGADGTLYYGRAEGLFRSRDQGEHWIAQRTRPESQYRDLEGGVSPAQHAMTAGAGYGTGTVVHDVDANSTQLLLNGCPFAFQKAVAVSPHHAGDGTLLVSGEYDIVAYYDPALPPANPFGATGWRIPDLVDLATGKHTAGYARVLSFSPHYDGRGTPGSDQTFYWSSWDEVPMRSQDGGRTTERLPEVAGGGAAPFMEFLVVAPTYDASSAAGRTDVYAAAATVLYRLEDVVWVPVATFASYVNGIAVDPGFARPGNPRLLVALSRSPSVVEVLDFPGGALITELGSGLADEVMTDVAVPPDYAARPVLYASTWGRGVLRLDRAQPVPAWEPVASGFPRWFVERIALSPFFATDRAVYAGTLYGLVRGQDLPGAAWAAAPGASFWDDRDAGFTYYAPMHPLNPQPARPWPWGEANLHSLPPEVQPTAELLYARYDASRIRAECRGSQVRVRTVAGPAQGSMELAARDSASGALLATAWVDLAAGQPLLRSYEAILNLPARSTFDLDLIAHLDAGEVLHFDGMIVQP